jgi:hypothetical protein
MLSLTHYYYAGIYEIPSNEAKPTKGEQVIVVPPPPPSSSGIIYIPLL